MKRFGMYNNDFQNLFECYSRVNGTISEMQLPSTRRHTIDTTDGEPSFPGARILKIFTMRPGGGADLTHEADEIHIRSDDGSGGVILSATDRDGRTYDISLISKPESRCEVKSYDSTGGGEMSFKTNVPIRYDPVAKDITIINIMDQV